MSKHLHDRVREDVERRQRNTVWPHTVRNARSVDAFLWNGNPNAPMVQRVGAVIWGLGFVVCAALLVYIALSRSGFWPFLAFALGSGYIGCRMLRNAFRH
jgi:hypothetical protein